MNKTHFKVSLALVITIIGMSLNVLPAQALDMSISDNGYVTIYPEGVLGTTTDPIRDLQSFLNGPNKAIVNFKPIGNNVDVEIIEEIKAALDEAEAQVNEPYAAAYPEDGAAPLNIPEGYENDPRIINARIRTANVKYLRLETDKLKANLPNPAEIEEQRKKGSQIRQMIESGEIKLSPPPDRGGVNIFESLFSSNPADAERVIQESRAADEAIEAAEYEAERYKPPSEENQALMQAAVDEQRAEAGLPPKELIFEAPESVNARVNITSSPLSTGQQRLNIESNGVTARAQGGVSYNTEDGRISVDTETGEDHQLNHLPDEAVEKMSSATGVNVSTDDLEIISDDEGEVYYKGSGTTNEKLFGLIWEHPKEKETYLNDKTGQVFENEIASPGVMGQMLDLFSF